MPLSKAFLLLAFPLLCFSALHGQILQAYAPCTEDTYVQSGSTAYNSASTLLYADVSSSYIRRAYLKFDIASLSIPANAIVTSASIQLYVNAEPGVNSTTYTVQRTRVDWDASTLTFANQPQLLTADATSYSTPNTPTPGGIRSFDVKLQVQDIIRNASNRGFCIRRSNESVNTSAASYASNEVLFPKPVLEINYYLPVSLVGALIQHESRPAAADGKITPHLANGPGGNSYFWSKNGGALVISTDPVLTNVGYGWYSLRVLDSQGNNFYYSFIVGLQCGTVDIAYDPGPNFIDDATYQSSTFSWSGGATTFTAARSSIFVIAVNNISSFQKFRLWMPENLQVLQSDLLLKGSAHTSSANNESVLERNTQDWDEYPVISYPFPPSTSTDITVVIPNKTTATANSTVNMNSYWNYWKQNNLANYGVTFKRNNEDNVAQVYHSADATTAANRPSIAFRVSNLYESHPCYCNAICATLEKQPQGVPYPVCLEKFRFAYEEEYTASTVLKYSVKNTANAEVMSTSTTPLSKEYGDNRYELNISALAAGVYMLEVVNEKNEKFYLRFSK